MSFELNFEQLQQKLKRVLNPSRFRFVVILYPNTNMIGDIKNHIKEVYPTSLVTNLDLKDKTYQDISNELYKNDEGFVYINDFEEILNNPDLYNGFNQRRDKIASYNINIICFISLYKKDELFTKAIEVIPDLWEFKNTILEMEKIKKSDDLAGATVNESSSYSSFGGLTTKSKKIELEKLLKKFDKVESDELKLNLLYQITAIYQDIGDYTNSLYYAQLELEIQKKVGDKHPDLARSYNNISTIYQNMGELNKALEYQEKALKLAEEIFGDKHPDLARSYNNISTIYGNMGECKIALEYQKKALNIQLEILGEKHPDLARSYNNISTVYHNMGEFKIALEYQKKALNIQLEISGEKHLDLATSYNNISTIYKDMGELNKALEYQEKALKLTEEILGDKHPNLATSYSNISTIYQDIKECQKAQEFIEKAIYILENLNYERPSLDIYKRDLKIIKSTIKKQKRAGFKNKGRYCKDI